MSKYSPISELDQCHVDPDYINIRPMIRLVGSYTTPQINKPSCQQYNKIAAYITPNKRLNASSEFISVEELTKVYD